MSSNPTVLQFVEEKRNLLFSRVAICGIVIGSIHTLTDSLDGLRAAPIIDACFTAIILGAYWLNRVGHHRTAKSLALLVLNLGFVAYASVLPKEVGVYIFYLPLVAVAASVFDNHHWGLRYFFMLLPLVCLLALFLSDFSLMGPIAISASDIPESYMLNLFSSTIFLLLCIRFLIVINQQSENLLLELTEQVQQKNERLEKTNEELDRFLYSTSHDLRAPLMSIKGLVNLANREYPNNTPKYLSLMDQQTDKLDLFIKEIIDYSKNARTELEAEEVNVREIAEEITTRLRFAEGAERISFRYDMAVEQVETDKTRLQVILNNLVSNAIKYHDLAKPMPEIAVTTARSSGHWILEVSDNGKGISKQYHQKIFDMFYRADETSKGSGLGLYIVREAVQKLQGQIELQSEPGRGSTFRLTFPWQLSSAATPTPAAHSA